MSTDETVTVNGEEYSSEAYKQAVGVIQRQQLATQARTSVGSSSTVGGSNIQTPGDIRSRFGQQFGTDRDVWDVLGYDKTVDATDYREKYRRQDVARRIVELPPKDTWREAPTVSDSDGEDQDSDFESSANDLIEQTLNAYWRRADIAAGIGEYGLLFLGFADGAADLSEPVVEASSSDDLQATQPPEDLSLAYLGVFAQDQVDGWQLGKDDDLSPTDPMYNRPVRYDIDFGDLDGDENDDEIEEVHWQRVIHIAEGAVESDLKGTPRLRPVYNRLMDLEKVVGASAEMFWTGADRKYHFDIRDEYGDLSSDDLDALDEEVQKLVHELQPYIKTTGTDVNVLGGEEVDPSGVVDSTLKFISGATGIPLRKLVGSERGEQASTQDRANWFDTVRSRQVNFGEPQLLRPTIDRLVAVGVLPDPADGSYDVEWPNLFELTEVEESEVAFNRARAAQATAPQGNTDILPGGMAGAVEYVETGEFPDPAPIGPDPMDEVDADDPAVQRAFERLQQVGADD